MNIIQKNLAVGKSKNHEPSSGSNTELKQLKPFVIAGLDFSVYFNLTEDFHYQGVCSGCQKNFVKKGDKMPIHSVYIKVIEVDFGYKVYTAESVVKANPFVQHIFKQIIIALRKKVHTGELFCDKCVPNVLDQTTGIVIWDTKNQSKSYVKSRKSKIRDAWFAT